MEPTVIKRWDRQKIENDLWQIYFAMTDPRMDGFVTWGCKQDLLRIKYYLDDLLQDSPTYVGEDKFVEELEAEKTFKILKREKHQ